MLTAVASLALLVQSSVRADDAPQPTLVAGRALSVQLPIRFEPADPAGQPAFICRGAGYSAVLTTQALSLSLVEKAHGAALARPLRREPESAVSTATVLNLRFAGASAGAAPPEGQELQLSKTNYFIGRDQSKWRANVPNFAKATVRRVWPGIDLTAYGTGREMEFDFVLAPGANPALVRVEADGAQSLAIAPNGDLEIRLPAGAKPIFLRRPVAYQPDAGGARRPVAAAFEMAGPRTIALALGAYDRAKPLVVDPVLSYSSYFGGLGDDRITAVAVDSAGRYLVAGSTTGLLPTTLGGYDRVYGGGDSDAFVAKIATSNTSGSAQLIFSTYLGGVYADEAAGVAANSANAVYVAGYTRSPDFPMSAAYGPQGGADVFVTQLSANGSSLLYSGLIGGTLNDYGNALALDSQGNPYVTGYTNSSDFPTQNPVMQFSGNGDAFMLRVNISGKYLSYSTFLGGTGYEEGMGIAVDASGNAYATGITESANFYTKNPIQYYVGLGDAWVAKINSGGSGFYYSTFLGGEGYDIGLGIAAESTGVAAVTGQTKSFFFPTVNAFQPVFGQGGGDAFVARLHPSGSSLLCSTYLGGSGDDLGYAICYSRMYNVVVGGATTSDNFPLKEPLQLLRSGAYDAFVTRFNAGGDGIVFSTYLGGSGDDTVYAATPDRNADPIIGGLTCGGFPLGVNPPEQSKFGGGVTDGFVSLLKPLFATAQDDVFTSGNVQPPGSATGWSPFGVLIPGLAVADYDATGKAFRGIVTPDPTHYRIAGWQCNLNEWLKYADIGPSRIVRTKYFIYTTGRPTGAPNNMIPNLRLRASVRFAYNSMLEVLHHSNSDPSNQALASELRPSSDATHPSLYRVDLDVCDVPYLASNSGTEGAMRAMESYSTDPQDSGAICMAESVIGTYPADRMPDIIPPQKIYAPSGGTAGSLAVQNVGELDKYNLVLSPNPGEFGTREITGPQPTYGESAAGITMDSTAVPASKVGIVTREFFPGSVLTASSYMRVSEGKQYRVLWHVTSTQQSNLNAGLRLRGRSAKFAWSQKLELGGAWGTGGTTPGANNIISQQMLPGVGCLNPDKIDVEQGGWYRMIVQSPMSYDIRADILGPLTTRMPLLSAEPGPGVNAASRRDLRFGCDLVDTTSAGTNAFLEQGNFTIDRIEVTTFNLVDD